MKNYLIKYTIDVSAETLEDAVMEVVDIMKSNDGFPPIFEVYQGNEDSNEIATEMDDLFIVEVTPDGIKILDSITADIDREDS